jgi:hypothetical protein
MDWLLQDVELERQHEMLKSADEWRAFHSCLALPSTSRFRHNIGLGMIRVGRRLAGSS